MAAMVSEEAACNRSSRSSWVEALQCEGQGWGCALVVKVSSLQYWQALRGALDQCVRTPSRALLAVMVVACGSSSVMACEGPREVRKATPASIAAFVRQKQMEVFTFMGYSGAEYESPEVMRQQVAKILESKDPQKTFINSGGTAQGIGAVYAIAKQKGFTTMGIVSSLVQKERVPLSRCVDVVFVVKDSSWGGRLPGTNELSPTSLAIVANSASVVAIGGGDVARDEWLAARQAGKPVVFLPAEMNHTIAREKARKQGKPLPTAFQGSLQPAAEH